MGDRVLVRRVRFESSPHKLVDKWEEGVYVVTKCVEDLPVYDVIKEGYPQGKTRRLHRNLLLPIGEVTTHTDMTKSKPSVRPKEDKRPEERVADTDSSS